MGEDNRSAFVLECATKDLGRGGALTPSPALTATDLGDQVLAKSSIPQQAVYAIRCVDGRCYVGASQAHRRRWTWHRTKLNAGTHKNAKLQAAWFVLGAAAFSFEVLEDVEQPEDLASREQFWMDGLRAATDGFNLSPTAGGSNRGIVRSAEVRARVTASHIGTQVGVKNPSAKLNEDKVREIRRRVSAGESRVQVAKQYGVSASVVNRTVRREKWSHVL